MSKKAPERKETKPIDRMAPPQGYLANKAAYLAGKPIRMHWWMLVLYVIPLLFLAWLILEPVIYDNIHFGAPIPRETIFLLVGILCIFLLPPITRMARRVILEENGLVFRDVFRKWHKIAYSDIVAYTVSAGRAEGITVQTSNGKKYAWHADLAGYRYLCEEIKGRVGADKEVKNDRKFLR